MRSIGGVPLTNGSLAHLPARPVTNLVRIRIQKFEAGAFDDEAVAADTIEVHEARIAALERLVGRLPEARVRRRVATP